MRSLRLPARRSFDQVLEASGQRLAPPLCAVRARSSGLLRMKLDGETMASNSLTQNFEGAAPACCGSLRAVATALDSGNWRSLLIGFRFGVWLASCWPEAKAGCHENPSHARWERVGCAATQDHRQFDVGRRCVNAHSYTTIAGWSSWSLAKQISSPNSLPARRSTTATCAACST